MKGGAGSNKLANNPLHMQRLKNNPKGFTAQDFAHARDVIMGLGALLQQFPPGVLPAMADVIHKDLADAKSLMLGTIKRRRGQKMIRVLLVADILRARTAELAMLMDLLDVEEGK